jgi:predicted porin
MTLSYTLKSNLNTYLCYAYGWRKTHTSFVNGLSIAYFSNEVEYKEKEHTCTAGFNYQLRGGLNLSGYFSYVKQNANFDSSELESTDLTLLANLGQFSNHDIDTIEASLTCAYQISKNFSTNVQFIYERFNNDVIYLYDMSGNGYIAVISLNWQPF